MDNREKNERIRAAYRNVFAHKEAGIVLKDLEAVVGFMDVMFLGERREWQTEAQAAHKDGMRRVFLRILRFSGREDLIRQILEKS